MAEEEPRIGGFTLKIRVEADQRALSHIRRTVTEWLHAAKLSPEQSFDLVLAINEATSNVVAHAYRNGSGALEIEVRDLDDSVVARICDTGRWRRAEESEGGRGYPMMQALVDSMEVSSTESGTEVLLRQKRSSRNGEKH